MTITVVRARVQSRTMDWSSLVTLGTVACQAPWDSPGKNIGVGCHFLLQGIFPTQESNPGLRHCRQTLYQLSYEGSPKCEAQVSSVQSSHSVVSDSLVTTWTEAHQAPWDSPGKNTGVG